MALYTAQLIRGLWDLRDTGLPALARWGDPIFRPILLGLLAVAITDDSLSVRPRQWEQAAIRTLRALLRALLAPFRAVLGVDGVNEPGRGFREVEERMGRGVHEVGEKVGRGVNEMGEKVLGKRGEGKEGGNGEDKRQGGAEERERRGGDGDKDRRGGGLRDEGERQEGQGFRFEGMRRGGDQVQEKGEGGGQKEGNEGGPRHEQDGQNRGIDE